MSRPPRRPGRSRAVRLGTSLAAGGGICIVASMLIAFLVADHSSSDSSPSSLVAIGLGSIGVDLPPHMGLLGLGRVQADLEAILGTKVDLVPASDLKPEVRARAERDLVAL